MAENENRKHGAEIYISNMSGESAPPELVSEDSIRDKIYTIRGRRVMLDSDLAELYGVETRYLNKAVNRNIERFPEDFRFVLSKDEEKSLMFQIGTSKAMTASEYLYDCKHTKGRNR